MTKILKTKVLSAILFLFAVFSCFAFGILQPIAEEKTNKQLAYAFDSGLFVNKMETSTAKLSCQEGFMYINTTSDNEDGFQFSVDAPQDIDRFEMSNYNFVKFKLKRNAACQGGRFQLYFWKSYPDNAFASSVTYRSDFLLGEEYDDKWVEVILDLRTAEKNGKGVIVKNMETGEIKEQGFNDFMANGTFSGGLFSMRLNFARGNKSKDKEAWMEYMAFFENKEDAVAFDGLSKSRLTNAEEVLSGDLAPSEFALPYRTEEKIVKLATDYTEELLGISTELVNYSYEYPTKTEYGYIEYDAVLCSGGYYHFVEGVRLMIEPEPGDPILYKFDNEKIINRLLSQGKMSVEAYYLDGVMKIVQADPYQDDGFWVLIDTVADNNRFLMQSYPIIQYRINVTGQAPSQLFFANYAAHILYNIGYDEGEWLTVTIDTAKTAGAIEVVNEDKGTVQILNWVNSLYSTNFTPPAFRGLSDEFRFNFGRRSGLERSALVDYIGFFPTMEAAQDYSAENRDPLTIAKKTLADTFTIDYVKGATKESAVNEVKLALEREVGASLQITVNPRTYVAPILGQVDGALTGSVTVSNGTITETLLFKAIIGKDKKETKQALQFGSKKVLDYLLAGAGTQLSYDGGLVMSGESRKVSSIELSAADKINLNAYGYIKLGFKSVQTGTATLTLKTDGGDKSYQATLAGDSAVIPATDLTGIMNGFALELSGAGATTVTYIAFFESEEQANAFESEALNVSLENLELNEIIAAQCYNEREATREARKAVEKQLPDGCAVEIIPVELVKPTRNAGGSFRFKALLTSENVFGAFGVESKEFVLPIAKISYYDTTEFYFNGESYAYSQKKIDNSAIVTVELTIKATATTNAVLLQTDKFSICTVNDEIVVQANGEELLASTTLSLVKRGKTRIAVVFEETTTSLYIDGTLYATGEPLESKTGASVIFVGGTATGDNFDGTLGEVKIWNLVRTREEISRYAFEKMQGTEKGLIAYWRTENDNCGFNNRVDGENALVFVDEYENYYHEFTGYDFLQSAKAVSYSPKTVELWVKPYKENKGAKTILTNDFGTPSAQSFGIYTTETGGLTLRYGTNLLAVDELSLYDGRWHHIAFTFGASETLFYHNGTLQKTFDIACSGALGTANYYFGTHTPNFDSKGYGGGKFEGELANVRFWSVERTAAQIAENKKTLYGQGVENLLWNLTLNASKDLVFADTVGGNSVKIMSESWYKIINEETVDYWTSVVLPDPQDYAVASTTRQGRDWESYDEWRFYNFNMAINDWIIDNKTRENIELVLTVGDLTQNATPTEWELFSEHMGMLDGIVPYTLVLGNHDLQSAFGYGSDTRGSEEFNKVFKYDEWKEKDCYGGSFEEGNLDNTYYLFEIRGEKYMVICLEFEPRDEVLEWFDYIVKKYSDYKVIITTHENLVPAGHLSTGIPNYGLASKDGATTNNGLGLWNKLAKNNPNVLQVVSGHVGGGLTYVEMEGDNGNTVQHITADTWSTAIYSNPTVEGIVTLCRYYDDGRVDVRLYDPVKNCYYVSEIIYSEDMSEERGI